LSESTTEPIRLAHFSDIHVTSRRCSWRREDWLNKRLAAWMNLRILGRGFRFRDAERVLSALVAELDQSRPNHLIFSGDATAMGFEEELRRAIAFLPLDRFSGLAVPGNHDYCTKTAMLAGHFEKWFAPWQVGERIDNHVYPFVQKIGPIRLIGLCSATANRWAWDARGAVGQAQLERLQQLLEGLDDGLRILVTHYPVAVASGRREPIARHLRDLDRVLRVAEKGKIRLWLHGHRHKAYHHASKDLASFPIICAGSATQTGIWGYWNYQIDGSKLQARQRVFEPQKGEFAEGKSLDLDLVG
jgi:3',5'-cyclic AMP phosphodiesterase CpdA